MEYGHKIIGFIKRSKRTIIDVKRIRKKVRKWIKKYEYTKTRRIWDERLVYRR